MFSQSHTALVLGYLKTIAGDDVKKLEGREVVNPEDGDDIEEFYRGRFQQEDRERYWRMMHEYIGSDVTSLVKLPILIFEPMTMLQKMAELMEYAYLLDQADQCEDPYLKMVFAACWAVSVYSAYQRTWKPFNPILGETFEMVNHNGITFLAEQVSQHPSVSAAHAENDHFTYDVTSKLKTKFLGNSLDVYPVGRTRVVLKSTGDVLELIPPSTKVHNVIFGRTWVDSTGNMILKNLTTGDDVVLYFHPCGWCGNDRYKVDGYVYNKDDEAKMLVVGEWNSFLGCQPCDVEGIPLLGTELQEIWTVANVPENDEFQYTYFAHKINSFETAPNNLLSSDSRLRLDRYALETGYIANAGFEKSRLEEKQLAEEREREARQDRFSPRWFNMSGEVITTPWDDLEIYEYTGKYHQERAVNRVSELSNVSILKQIKFNPWQYDDVESMSMAPTTPWDDLKI